MKLSERAEKLVPSEPRRIYDEAQKYTGVIDLTLGDPDLPLPSQYAAIEALSDRTDESYIRREFEKRRNCVLEELRTIPEITSTGIPATFYAFLDISKTGMSGEEFAMSLLKSKQVALIHGSAYGGPAYRNFIRIAFTMDCAELRKAFARIREFLAERS